MSDRGQIQVRYRSDTGQIQVRYRSDTGQIQVRYRSDTGKIFNGRFEVTPPQDVYGTFIFNSSNHPPTCHPPGQCNLLVFIAKGLHIMTMNPNKETELS
jgi:hypothetical protein